MKNIYVLAIASLCLPLPSLRLDAAPCPAENSSFFATAPLIGTTTFNTNFSATANLLPLTAASGTVANVGNTSESTGILASGWDFTVASTGNVSISVSAAGAAPGGAADYCIRMNANSGTFQYGGTKSDDGSTFGLQSVSLRLNITAGAPASFTLTGYRGGVAVPGATLTVSSIATNTWTAFNASSVTAFNNVDEFRFSQATGGTATVTYIVVDQITIIAPTPLPLKLTDFSGKKEGSNVNLQWTTAMEQNTSYFDVERGATPTSFAPIGKVNAAGNSDQPITYHYVDAPAAGSSWYYRLTMVDLDGKFTYSPVLRIGDPPATLSFAVYPNPIGSSANVLIGSPTASKAQLSVYDMNGRVLLTEALSLQQGNTLYTLPLAGRLPKGVYWLTVVTPQGKQSISIVKGE